MLMQSTNFELLYLRIIGANFLHKQIKFKNFKMNNNIPYCKPDQTRPLQKGPIRFGLMVLIA